VLRLVAMGDSRPGTDFLDLVDAGFVRHGNAACSAVAQTAR